MNETAAKKHWSRAVEALSSANLLTASGNYNDAASRAYYAIMHAAEAGLATKDILVDSHKGVSRMFSRHLVKTGDVETERSKQLSTGSDLRVSADYDIEHDTSREEAEAGLSVVPDLDSSGRVEATVMLHIEFAFDSAKLTTRARCDLDRVAAALVDAQVRHGRFAIDSPDCTTQDSEEIRCCGRRSPRCTMSLESGQVAIFRPDAGAEPRTGAGVLPENPCCRGLRSTLPPSGSLASETSRPRPSRRRRQYRT